MLSAILLPNVYEVITVVLAENISKNPKIAPTPNYSQTFKPPPPQAKTKLSVSLPLLSLTLSSKEKEWVE